jgi:RHS repeat-associated protein
VSHESDLNASNVVTGQRWTTHSDGVDDLLAVTLQAGAGPSSPTAFLSGPSAPSNVSYYYHTDHQGSVRAITDQSGAVTNAYAYDSYGTAQESVESLAQRFRYTGREYDALTGLYHYRARAYDPDTARFLQEDPIWFEAGDLNVYRMTWNNPVSWVDPSGMSAMESAGVYQGAADKAEMIQPVGNAGACLFNIAASAVMAVNHKIQTGAQLPAFIAYKAERAEDCGVAYTLTKVKKCMAPELEIIGGAGLAGLGLPLLSKPPVLGAGSGTSVISKVARKLFPKAMNRSRLTYRFGRGFTRTPTLGGFIGRWTSHVATLAGIALVAHGTYGAGECLMSSE